MLVVALNGTGLACGGEEELSADERRYCELTAAVEAKGEEAFGDLGEDPTEEELAAAQQRFIEDVDPELDEMVEAAPEEIGEDVEAFTRFTRQQMRGEEAEEVSDEKILAWEEENCPS